MRQRLLDLLDDLEWSCLDYGCCYTCPSCGGIRPDELCPKSGHTENCELVLVRQALEAGGAVT